MPSGSTPESDEEAKSLVVLELRATSARGFDHGVNKVAVVGVASIDAGRIGSLFLRFCHFFFLTMNRQCWRMVGSKWVATGADGVARGFKSL